ncbi:hypothetical protein STANM309S_00603 [Streptomyces tanashiensis]
MQFRGLPKLRRVVLQQSGGVQGGRGDGVDPRVALREPGGRADALGGQCRVAGAQHKPYEPGNRCRFGDEELAGDGSRQQEFRAEPHGPLPAPVGLGDLDHGPGGLARGQHLAAEHGVFLELACVPDGGRQLALAQRGRGEDEVAQRDPRPQARLLRGGQSGPGEADGLRQVSGSGGHLRPDQYGDGELPPALGGGADGVEDLPGLLEPADLGQEQRQLHVRVERALAGRRVAPDAGGRFREGDAVLEPAVAPGLVGKGQQARRVTCPRPAGRGKRRASVDHCGCFHETIKAHFSVKPFNWRQACGLSGPGAAGASYFNGKVPDAL